MGIIWLGNYIFLDLCDEHLVGVLLPRSQILDGWYYYHMILWRTLLTVSSNPGTEWTLWPKSLWLAGPFLPPPHRHWHHPQDKHDLDFITSHRPLIQNQRTWCSDSLPLCWSWWHDAWGSSGQPIWGSTSSVQVRCMMIWEVCSLGYLVIILMTNLVNHHMLWWIEFGESPD